MAWKAIEVEAEEGQQLEDDEKKTDRGTYKVCRNEFSHTDLQNQFAQVGSTQHCFLQDVLARSLRFAQ